MFEVFTANLRIKLIGTICLILAIALGIVSFVSYKKTAAVITKNLTSTQQAVATGYSQEIEAEFNVLFGQAYSISSSARILNTTDKKQIAPILAAELKRFAVFDNLLYFDLEGNAIDVAGKESFNGDRDYFKVVKQT